MLYWDGWQLIAQRPDQPTPGDARNTTRVNSIVQRGFTHTMVADGNMLVNGTVEPLDTLRFFGQRGLASCMDVGWALHTFYQDPAHTPSYVRRQYSPFVNRTRYKMKIQQIEQVIRAASPWLAGVMNDLEFPPWTSYFPDLDERLGNRPSASAPEWPSFKDWPAPNAHKLPAGQSNWTLEKLFFNMPRWTHNDGGSPGTRGAVLRIAGAADGGGSSGVSMVAQLFQPRAPTLARADIWLRLTAAALPTMPYLSYYVVPLKVDGTPDVDHPVLCAIPRRKAGVVSSNATGKFITCGLRATELAALIDPNATKPILANSSAWLPIKLVRASTHARAVCLLLCTALRLNVISRVVTT